MNKAKSGLQVVAAPASGWCDPATGACHIEAADEPATVEANNENAAGDALRSDERHRQVSLPAR
jgi:hypothetical protein